MKMKHRILNNTEIKVFWIFPCKTFANQKEITWCTGK